MLSTGSLTCFQKGSRTYLATGQGEKTQVFLSSKNEQLIGTLFDKKESKTEFVGLYLTSLPKLRGEGDFAKNHKLFAKYMKRENAECFSGCYKLDLNEGQTPAQKAEELAMKCFFEPTNKTPLL